MADLYFAALNNNLEKAKKLIDAAKDKVAFVNQPYINNDRSQNAIHGACDNGHVEMVKLLLDNGNKDTIKSLTIPGRYTPLHCAYFNGHVNVRNLLVKEKANQSAENSKGKAPWQLAKEGINWK